MINDFESKVKIMRWSSALIYLGKASKLCRSQRRSRGRTLSSSSMYDVVDQLM